VSGNSELVANAMVMKGEKEREINFRKEPLRPEPEPPKAPAAKKEAAHV
jgi:hypothetical protein